MMLLILRGSKTIPDCLSHSISFHPFQILPNLMIPICLSNMLKLSSEIPNNGPFSIRSLKKKKRYIYNFKSRSIKRERNFQSVDHSPNGHNHCNWGTGWRQKAGTPSRFPIWETGAKTLGPSSFAIPGALAGNWHWSAAAAGMEPTISTGYSQPPKGVIIDI